MIKVCMGQQYVVNAGGIKTKWRSILLV